MSHPTRRRFLRGAIGLGTTLGLGAWRAVPGLAAVSSSPPFDRTGMPYRQDDPRWASDPLWDRDLVIQADTAPLVRAYRSLSPSRRRDLLVMVKTGTYDDSVASHYVLLHPTVSESPDDPDAAILDPAMPAAPARRDRPWRLSDSARWITQDPEIAEAWRADAITPTQLGGAWVFARWDGARGATSLRPLLQAWVKELPA